MILEDAAYKQNILVNDRSVYQCEATVFELFSLSNLSIEWLKGVRPST
jgi:hypothetical protein